MPVVPPGHREFRCHQGSGCERSGCEKSLEYQEPCPLHALMEPGR